MKLKEQKTNSKKFKRSAKQIGERGGLLGTFCFFQNYMYVDSTLIAN